MIEKGECLFPNILREPPRLWSFPSATVISGLSSVRSSLRAGDASGSLITANYTLEQAGALPSRALLSPSFAGTNKLLREGAKAGFLCP